MLFSKYLLLITNIFAFLLLVFLFSDLQVSTDFSKKEWLLVLILCLPLVLIGLICFAKGKCEQSDAAAEDLPS